MSLRWLVVRCWVVLALTPALRGDDIAAALKEARRDAGRKDYDGALRRVDAAIARHPELADVPEAHGLRSRLHPQPSLAAAYLLRADARLHKRDWEGCLADCAVAARLQSADPEVNRVESFAYAHLGRYDESLAALDRAVAREPKDLSLRMGGAAVAFMAGQTDRAIAACTDCIPLSAPLAYCQRGLFEFAAGRHDEAFADWASAIRLQPRDPLAWMTRSMARSVLGQDDAALADADEVVRRWPDVADAHANRGFVVFAARRYDRAIADFDEAIRPQPDNGFLVGFRALARWRAGDHAGAIRDAERAVKLQPDDPKAARMLAHFLATAADPQLRDGRRALTLAAGAVERTGRRDVYYLQALAAAQAEVGQFPQAIATAAEALRLPFDAPKPNVHCEFAPADVRRVSVGIDSHRQSDVQALRVELTHALDSYRTGQPYREAATHAPLAPR